MKVKTITFTAIAFLVFSFDFVVSAFSYVALMGARALNTDTNYSNVTVNLVIGDLTDLVWSNNFRWIDFSRPASCASLVLRDEPGPIINGLLS